MGWHETGGAYSGEAELIAQPREPEDAERLADDQTSGDAHSWRHGGGGGARGGGGGGGARGGSGAAKFDGGVGKGKERHDAHGREGEEATDGTLGEPLGAAGGRLHLGTVHTWEERERGEEREDPRRGEEERRCRCEAVGKVGPGALLIFFRRAARRCTRQRRL
jgi:hypothetical protein